MAKLVLDDIGNFNVAGLTKINENSARIEAAFDNTLSRDGTTPNQMEADLDLNSNDILNVDNIDAKVLEVNHIIFAGEEIVPGEIFVRDAMLQPIYDPNNYKTDLFSAFVSNVENRTELKGLDTSSVKTVYLKESGREGQFHLVDYGTLSTLVDADIYEGLFVRSTDDPSKVWAREGWAVVPKNVRWYGAGPGVATATNFAIIQHVLDLRGTVVIEGNADGDDIEISDTLLVRSNTAVHWAGTSFIKLAQASTLGATFVAYHEGPFGDNQGVSTDVLFVNPRVDGGSLGYEADENYGENGIGGAFCDGLSIRGGVVKNCRNGKAVWSGSGGKGIQIENTVSNCTVEGTFILDCTIGCETGGATGTHTRNIHYSNLTMLRCDTMICGRRTETGTPVDVNVNSAVFENIVGYNCGKTTGYWADQGYQIGAIALDRVDNFDIQGVAIFNDSTYGLISCLVRHFRGNKNRVVMSYWGDATALIDSQTYPVGFGTSGSRNNNSYEIYHAVGSADRVLWTLSGDQSAHNGNTYKAKTATLNTELFNSVASQPDLFGFFENAAGDKTVDGPLNLIDLIHSRNYPSTMSRARVGSLQFNNVFLSFGTGTQILGSLSADDLVLVRNSAEKLRLLSDGAKITGALKGASDAIVIDSTNGIRLPNYTGANIGSAAHAVNTSNKAVGKMIWDTTNNRIMIAGGTGPTSAWYSGADPAVNVTPS